MNVLEVTDLRRSFGRLQALDGLTLSVPPGSITGLVGPNGSGKTTSFNAMTGFVRPDSGSVRFQGDEIAGLAPHRIVELGLARTFQNPSDLPNLSVMENLLAAGRDQPGDRLLALVTRPRRVRAAERALTARAWELLERMGLTALANARADDIGIGQGRLLQIARQLMTRPSMVLLDEPTSGLNPDDQQRLAEAVRGLRDEDGMTFLVIEHNLAFIHSVSDELYVMHSGSVIAHGAPAQVASDPRVIETYLGTAHAAA